MNGGAGWDRNSQWRWEKTVPNCNVFPFAGLSCSRHGSITPWPLSASPRCFEYHFAHLITISGFEEDNRRFQGCARRCSILTGRLRLFRSREIALPVLLLRQARDEQQRAERNLCSRVFLACVDYTSFDSNGEKRFAQGFAAIHPF